MRTKADIPIIITFQPPQGTQLPKFTSEPETVEVDPGTHQIVISLVTEGAPPGDEATFAPRAIDWIDKDGFVKIAPTGFSLTYSRDQLILQDQNVASTEGSYEFVVYVSYLDFTYASPDPTIINKQPSGTIRISFAEELLAVEAV